MEKIKRIKETKIKAVILLEAVVAQPFLPVFATPSFWDKFRKIDKKAEILQKEEVLRVAKMALKTGQTR